MRTRHLHPGIIVLMAGVLWVAAAADSPIPEYKVGDVAIADISSPGIVRVMNPELSERLKQTSAAQVPLIFRQGVTAADEAERELRASIDAARVNFLAALGRMPGPGDVGSPAFRKVLREAILADPNGPPIDRLAPLWVSGVSDTLIVDALLQPVREVMKQAIVNDQDAEPLSVDQPIRLIPVRDRFDAPGLAELETTGVITTAANLSDVGMARSVVASYFPTGQEREARFAAGFARANTFPAPGLTELLRARRRDEAIAYDTYTAGQVIVARGQVIDRKALAALVALREKGLIDALLMKVETKPSAALPIITDTKMFTAWVIAAGVVLLLILWRWGGPRARAPVAVPLPHIAESSIALAGDDAGNWRTRALLAEQRADRAHEAIRQGTLGWMKGKLFQSIFRQRADLLSTQQIAEAEMIELERRMEQLVLPLQERIRTYENRIKELEESLAAHDGDERHLVDARISLARTQLESERARMAGNF